MHEAAIRDRRKVGGRGWGEAGGRYPQRDGKWGSTNTQSTIIFSRIAVSMIIRDGNNIDFNFEVRYDARKDSEDVIESFSPLTSEPFQISRHKFRIVISRDVVNEIVDT
jgi:hypothetical protein